MDVVVPFLRFFIFLIRIGQVTKDKSMSELWFLNLIYRNRRWKVAEDKYENKIQFKQNLLVSAAFISVKK